MIDWAAHNAAAFTDIGVTAPRPLKLRIDDLVRLDRTWADDRHHSTELIDGRIYHTPARYIPRSRVMMALYDSLRRYLEALRSPSMAMMRVSIAMPPYDLPLPDIVLTSDTDSPDFVPAASVPLVIEVAQTGLDFFLGEKLRLYARHGIPEYWVADVNARVIHQLWAPADEAYGERREVAFGKRIEAATVEGLTVGTTGF